MESRQCQSCNKPIKGRSDKKFCDDYCRNNFNNQQRAEDNKLVRKINNALLRNRRILSNNLPESETVKRLKKETLAQQGFLFNFHTHQQNSTRGNLYRFCYEFGYLERGDGVVVVRRV